MQGLRILPLPHSLHCTEHSTRLRLPVQHRSLILALCHALCWAARREWTAHPCSRGAWGLAGSLAMPPAQTLTPPPAVSCLQLVCVVSSAGMFFCLLSVANSGSSLTSLISGVFPSLPSPAPPLPPSPPKFLLLPQAPRASSTPPRSKGHALVQLLVESPLFPYETLSPMRAALSGAPPYPFP